MSLSTAVVVPKAINKRFELLAAAPNAPAGCQDAETLFAESGDSISFLYRCFSNVGWSIPQTSATFSLSSLRPLACASRISPQDYRHRPVGVRTGMAIEVLVDFGINMSIACVFI